MQTGGMFFTSKWSIFQLIPKEYYPSTILVHAEDKIEHIYQQIKNASIEFPIIAKPDRGERGWGVKILYNKVELEYYKAKMNISFLVQAYVSYPIELSVFYYRNPNEKKGHVVSVTLKRLLSITGDGHSTIGHLILQNDRCFLQYKRLKKNNQINFSSVLQKGEKQLLVPYGNHVLGATFINYNRIIDEQLISTIDKLSKRIDGFYYGRFDLRCTCIDDLKKGINFSILEINGAASEPAHIYEPGFSFFKAQFTIARHFRIMYKIAKANHQNGVAYMSFKSFLHTKKLEREYRLNANEN